MNIEKLIARLNDFNPKAEVQVVAHCRVENFTITWGGNGEGETKKNCKNVSFYVDRLCQNENTSS